MATTMATPIRPSLRAPRLQYAVIRPGNCTWGRYHVPLFMAGRSLQGTFTSTTMPDTQYTTPKHIPRRSSARSGRTILTIWATSKPAGHIVAGQHISKTPPQYLPRVHFVATKQRNMSSVVARLHQDNTPLTGASKEQQRKRRRRGLRLVPRFRSAVPCRLCSSLVPTSLVLSTVTSSL